MIAAGVNPVTDPFLIDRVAAIAERKGCEPVICLNKCDPVSYTHLQVEPHPWLESCLLVKGSGDLEQLPAFQAGKCYVQDAAARLCALAADPKPGYKVLDACAAPGGKSFAMALAMGDQGDILARDLHENKLRRIQSGAKRLGLQSIHTAPADGGAGVQYLSLIHIL